MVNVGAYMISSQGNRNGRPNKIVPRPVEPEPYECYKYLLSKPRMKKRDINLDVISKEIVERNCINLYRYYRNEKGIKYLSLHGYDVATNSYDLGEKLFSTKHDYITVRRLHELIVKGKVAVYNERYLL